MFSTYAYSPYGEDFAAEQLNDKPLLDRFDLGSKLGGVATIQLNDRPQRRVVNKGAMGSPEVTYSAAEESDWQPYKFGGKESLARVGLDLYDFGARMYSPSNMRWMTMDPLAEKYYHISPYAYCAGNPVNYVDPDGRFAFVPILVKAALGAVVDLGAQMAFQMIAGASFEDAFSQVDWTSVGASALMGPLSALNKGRRFVSVAINMIDVGIDYSFSAGFDVAGVDKEGYKIAIDAISSLLTSASSDEIVNLFKEEYNSLVSNASYMAPLTNAERQAVRRKAEFVNGDFFKGFINSLSDFLGVTTGNTSKLLYKDWVEQPTEQKPLVLYYEQWVQSQGPVFQQGF